MRSKSSPQSTGELPENRRSTRLAPSPTGALHLGNARTFLLNWLYARSAGLSILLRIDDLDGPRIKPWATGQALDDLKWLGLDWDGVPVRQTQRIPRYREVIRSLLDSNRAYPCVCSRKDIREAASAPHGILGTVYPGTCRNRFSSFEAARPFVRSGNPPAIRFRTDMLGRIDFTDGFAGPQSFHHSEIQGDFVIAKSQELPSYQLATVIDDEDFGIGLVFRGDDLLPSTAQQLSLIQTLNFHLPKYIHTPLLIGEDGKRLAKRHGDTRISMFREHGVKPEVIVGFLAKISGMNPNGDALRPTELISEFKLQRIPKQPIVIRTEDVETLLRSKS